MRSRLLHRATFSGILTVCALGLLGSCSKKGSGPIPPTIAEQYPLALVRITNLIREGHSRFDAAIAELKTPDTTIISGVEWPIHLDALPVTFRLHDSLLIGLYAEHQSNAAHLFSNADLWWADSTETYAPGPDHPLDRMSYDATHSIWYDPPNDPNSYGVNFKTYVRDLTRDTIFVSILLDSYHSRRGDCSNSLCERYVFSVSGRFHYRDDSLLASPVATAPTMSGYIADYAGADDTGTPQMLQWDFDGAVLSDGRIELEVQTTDFSATDTVSIHPAH